MDKRRFSIRLRQAVTCLVSAEVDHSWSGAQPLEDQEDSERAVMKARAKVAILFEELKSMEDLL